MIGWFICRQTVVQQYFSGKIIVYEATVRGKLLIAKNSLIFWILGGNEINILQSVSTTVGIKYVDMHVYVISSSNKITYLGLDVLTKITH